MHLALLLHGQKYQKVDDEAHSGCRVPFCQFGRKLWRHIEACTEEAGPCTEPYCRVSREMLKHWEICSKSRQFCRMCTPLRVTKRKRVPSKKVHVPNCRTTRNLICHYKECTSKDSCPKCKLPNYLKGKLYGQRTMPKRRHSMLLKHACVCRDKKCENPMCIKMKRALTHTNVCQTKCSGSMVCREIAIFCLHHTIACTQPDCILTNAIDGSIDP